MSVQAPIPGFSCEDCGSPGIAIMGPLNDLAPVRCTGCGRDLGPWDLFLDDLNSRLAAGGVVHAPRRSDCTQRPEWQEQRLKQKVYGRIDTGVTP